MLKTLLVALTLSAAPHIPPSLDLAGGSASPIVSLVAWDKGGSQDWGAGIPSPTIDCAPLPGSTGGDIVCSGANPSKQGNPTTGTSPIWYRGDSAVRPSVTERGANYHNLGDVADASTAMTSCVIFNASSVAGATFIAHKNASNAGYMIYATTTSLVLRVCNGTGCTNGGTVTISAGSWYVACHAYSHALGKIIGNANGVAGNPATSVAGPIADTSADLTIGTASGPAVSVRRVAIWTGWAADAAQLAQLVATQWGLAADKPSGTVATHARTDSTYCGPFSDAELYLLGPGAPCIHAPTYQGWASGGAVAGGIEVYGAGANALVQSAKMNSGASELAPWTTTASGTIFGDGSVAPTGVTSTRITEGSAGTVTWGLYQTFGYSAATYTLAAWVKAGTRGCVTLAFTNANPISGAKFNLSAGSVGYTSAGNEASMTGAAGGWYRLRVTGPVSAGTSYPEIFSGGSDCSANSRPVLGESKYFDVADAQLTPTAYPVPYRATTGTAYSGSASTATTLTVPVALTDPARWAIAWTGTHGTWRDVPPHGTWLWGLAPSSSPNSFKMFIYDTDLTARIYDAAGTFTHRYITSAFSSGTHTVVASPGSLYPDLWLDGVRQSGGVTGGTGTGVMGSLPATLAIGKEPSGAGNEFNGLVSRVAQCRRAGGCR